jgi:hypothetical protein
MASSQTKLRVSIWNARPHVCNICKKPILQEQDFILDHIIARGLGGARFDWANLQVICKDCNEVKDRLDFAKIHGFKIESVTDKYLRKIKEDKHGLDKSESKITRDGS